MFTDGIDGHKTEDMETCPLDGRIAKAYKKINDADIRTFLVVTDMRNAMSSDNAATLSVAFTD